MRVLFRKYKCTNLIRYYLTKSGLLIQITYLKLTVSHVLRLTGDSK
jgi:hypothetical protein